MLQAEIGSNQRQVLRHPGLVQARRLSDIHPVEFSSPLCNSMHSGPVFRYAGRVIPALRRVWNRRARAGLLVLAIVASVPMAIHAGAAGAGVAGVVAGLTQQFFNGWRGDPSLPNI